MSDFIHEHSQFGEVELLIRHMVNNGPRQKIVVDVGANGVERSNSYDFMRQFGWYGLLVEANPALLDGIRAGFAGLKMDLVQCAISDYEGKATLHFGVNTDISSLDRAATASWGEVSGSTEVRVRRLPAVLKEFDIPDDFDLLSLDIEGHDIKALNDVFRNTAYRPEYIVFEASFNKTRDTFEKLEELGLDPGIKGPYRIADLTTSNVILKRAAAAPTS